MPPGNEVARWADQAMFEAAPIRRDDLGRVRPQVFLLSATPDPLGAVAAACRMYEGKPTYSLGDITDDERRHYWEQSIKTHLKAPWEFIDFHFFLEAVTRSFTHQAVRQRTAVFAQESLRFAVKEGLAQEVPLPPSILPEDENAAKVWKIAVKAIDQAYTSLVNAGIPAEDARGLLPHAVATRMNYKTNFRNLIEHAGNRLCTQAQFEWRWVFLGIMKAIREYSGQPYVSTTPFTTGMKPGMDDDMTQFLDEDIRVVGESDWQWELIGTPHASTFAPVCYHVGHCTFKASFDRQCTIRERVDAFAEAGVPADKWGVEGINWAEPMGAINPEEWMSDPTAGRRD